MTNSLKIHFFLVVMHLCSRNSKLVYDDHTHEKDKETNISIIWMKRSVSYIFSYTGDRSYATRN